MEIYFIIINHMKTIAFINYNQNNILYDNIKNKIAESVIDINYLNIKSNFLTNMSPEGLVALKKSSFGVYINAKTEINITNVFKKYNKPLIYKLKSFDEIINDINKLLHVEPKQVKKIAKPLIKSNVIMVKKQLKQATKSLDKNHKPLIKIIINRPSKPTPEKISYQQILKNPGKPMAKKQPRKIIKVVEKPKPANKPLCKGRPKKKIINIKKIATHKVQPEITKLKIRLILVIYTHNNPKQLNIILNTINKNILNNIHLCVFVYNDGSTKNYDITAYNNFSIEYYRSQKHIGEVNFLNEIYKDLQTCSYDYLIFISDKYLVQNDFIAKCMKYYQNIKDEKKILLSLNNNTQDKKNMITIVDYITLTFICGKKYLNVLDNAIDTKPDVIKYISNKLINKNYNLYLCNDKNLLNLI
jgi:hypothetical protein